MTRMSAPLLAQEGKHLVAAAPGKKPEPAPTISTTQMMPPGVFDSTQAEPSIQKTKPMASRPNGLAKA